MLAASLRSRPSYGAIRLGRQSCACRFQRILLTTFGRQEKSFPVFIGDPAARLQYRPNVINHDIFIDLTLQDLRAALRDLSGWNTVTETFFQRMGNQRCYDCGLKFSEIFGAFSPFLSEPHVQFRLF